MAIYKKDGVDGVNHYPKKFVTLYAAAAITKGDWVAFNADTTEGLGGSVSQAAGVSTVGNGGAFGVATETVTGTGPITIQTAGFCDFAAVDSSCDINIRMCGPIGTAGQAGLVAAATFGAVCVGLAADVSNVGSVMIIDQGYF
jgi:hypothetical protein